MSDKHIHHHSGGKNWQFWVGFFIGGLLGAFIIYVIGTKQGKKTSKVIEKKSRDLIDELQDKLEVLEARGKELAKQGDSVKKQVTKQLESAKGDLTKEATEKLDKTLAKVEKLQEDGVKETKQIRKRIFKNIPKKKK